LFWNSNNYPPAIANIDPTNIATKTQLMINPIMDIFEGLNISKLLMENSFLAFGTVTFSGIVQGLLIKDSWANTGVRAKA